MSEPNPVSVGETVLVDLTRFVDDGNEGWKLYSNDDGIIVQTRKSDVEKVPVDIIRCKIELENTDLATVLALVSPWLPYRKQWDEMLDKATILEQLTPEHRLVHHVTKKKFPMSARDSVDVVSLRIEPSRVLMASRSVTVPNFPSPDDVVRTYQHLGAYCFYKKDNGVIEFSMYFQCDLKVSAPALIQKMVDKAKPRFMCEKLKSLRKAVRNIKVDPSHLERW